MMITRRTAIGLAAVLLGVIMLAWRIRIIATTPRLTLAPRVYALMENRMLARRILAYATKYGRPAYFIDSVSAHLDDSEARLVADLSIDDWGDSVFYMWNYCGFRLARTPAETLPPRPFLSKRYHVEEEYAWPHGADRLCSSYLRSFSRLR